MSFKGLEPRANIHSAYPEKEEDYPVKRIHAFRDMIYGGTAPSQNCLSCKKTLLVGELYSDGLRDNVLFCHSCQRRDAEFDTLLRDVAREDARLAAYYAAEETICGREDTEEIQ